MWPTPNFITATIAQPDAGLTLAKGIVLSNSAYYLSINRLFKNLESYFWNGTTRTIDRFDNLGIVHDQTQWGNRGSVRVTTPFGAMKNDVVIGFGVNRIGLTYSNDFGSLPQEDGVDPYNFSPGLFFDTQGIAPRYRTRTNEFALFAEDRLALTTHVGRSCTDVHVRRCYIVECR